ncbi:RagB/SusD family nutrient uptake outer membrane protein [Lutibacter sp. B1]|uniref:RagB/SusD family nutrient uptake outer membrane protein n=1 Tax=Lutibacter sp. B1 TaxID=2725996 RepID=UPI001456FD3A|nr:RagB/SusD family nutrient uptake outer membrane protein [Lutibacter sp. B1]NLP58781.1 RagB/SusD family nutrient uptake outer membrane protein [Lutibacter sp. B1]
MKKINNLYKIVFALIFLVILNACTTDDLDPALKQNKDSETGIVSVDNLYALIKGAYSRMTNSEYYGRDYIVTNEVRTDNCFSNGNSGRFTTQAGFTYSANTGYIWDNCYSVISSANLIINTDLNSLEGDLDEGNHIKGQAYAIRALAHFDLLKTYGQQHVGGNLGVPYITQFLSSTSSEEELYRSRNTIEEVKNFILSDLGTAYDLMSVSSNKEFFSKYAAKALESRVALYFEMWGEAKAAAEIVINSGKYSIIPKDNYISSWESNQNVNSIFELAFSATDNQGINGLAYIYRTDNGVGSYGDVSALPNVATLYEEGDVRADILGYDTNRRGNTYLVNIGKYPDNQGYDNIPLIRYEEVILNYAEALFETGGDALTQLNLITSNRGATAYTSVTKDDILNERRKELIFEGFRFDDLVRTGKDIEKIELEQNFLNTIPYGDYRLAWPIPQSEMDANSNMEQNTGY